MLETNFFSPITSKRWSNLSWSDFKGIPPFFSKYDAAISSYIYLEFDSTRSQYHSYAAQLDMHSWTRFHDGKEHLLNHEQYHFNISELHARMMNDFISKNPDKRKFDYRMQLATFRGELSYMQDIYDDESDHSQNSDKQRRWEYKIDSLLLTYSPDSGWVNDYYSGGRIYFPSKPSYEAKVNENFVPYRQYVLYRYGMSLSFDCYQHVSFKKHDLVSYLSGHYTLNKLKIKSHSFQELEDDMKVSIIAEDTSAISHHDLWINKGPNLYKIRAKFSLNTPDTLGYYEIAQSFINSFSIRQTDNHWLEFAKDNPTPEITISKTERVKPGTISNCMRVGDGESRGFYKEPFYNHDGTLILPFDVLYHSDSLILENVLILGNEIYSFEANASPIIYSIPADKQPKDPYVIHFGYILKNDSTKCPLFYNQLLEINPARR